MKIIHFECGLGNQMLDYCDYLAMKYANPKAEIYAETIMFDIPECQEVISAWNGFELTDIFGITMPNIKELFSVEQWKRILNNVRESKFWNHGWEYSSAISAALASEGLFLENRCRSLYSNSKIRKAFNFIKGTRFWSELLIYKTDMFYRPIADQLFFHTDKDVYCGHTLEFMNVGNKIETIENEIRNTFVFPKVEDEKNSEIIKKIKNCNSIGIHIRRDDAMIGINRSVFYTGYYKHAVEFIKTKVPEPVFYIFGTKKTINWCKENLFALGLNTEKDSFFYVDWNTGKNSFRDMQLLSLCKHSIISKSSFGWWGSFLNMNPNKITISPLKKMNTTHHI